MAAEHVVQDRTTAGNVAIVISDGELNYNSTVNSVDGEPIMEDQNVPGTHYTVFIDDGQLAVEPTATVQNDEVVLEDTVTATDYQLVIRSGELVIIPYVAGGGGVSSHRQLAVAGLTLGF